MQIEKHLIKVGSFSNNRNANSVVNNLTFDTAFKKVFRRKDVLAGILINVVPEFKGMTYEEVKERIPESSISIVNADLKENEDVDENQKIIYDVITEVLIPYGKKEVHLIFDLEMQRKYNAGYPLMNRAIYYTSRLIAKQAIEKADYNSLVPVQSTWICLKGVPKHLQNRAFHFEYTAYEDEKIVDDVKLSGQNLTRIDLLLLSEDYDWDYHDTAVIKFLQSVFKDNLKNDMFNPYILDVDDLEEEVSDMLGGKEQFEYEREYELGQALKQGIEQGKLNNLFELVQDGLITSNQAAERVDMTVTEFEIKMLEAGYTV